MKLQSIAKEAAICRAAWAAMPDATAGVHIHHGIAAEALSEPIEVRIAYIRAKKPKAEQALRLHLMRPATASAWAAYEKATASAWAWAAYEKATASAHTAICPTPDCPWDGRTIFGAETAR